MKIEYFKEYSHCLNRDMEFKVYGHGGKPILVFPAQNGRFYDFENFNMVYSIEHLINSGKVQLFCCDSIDKESWSDIFGDKRHRIYMHEQWYYYIVDELVPRIFEIGLSGYYDSDFVFYDYCDDLVYKNAPIKYIEGMPYDHEFVDKYRKNKIVICCGQGAWEDEMIYSTNKLKKILEHKNIGAWVDFWGTDVNHDWDWWRVQLPYFLEKIL